MDILAAPYLNTELGSSYFSSKLRKTKNFWSFGSNFSFVPGISVEISTFRSGTVGNREGFLLTCLKPSLVSSVGQKSCPVGSLAASAWAVGDSESSHGFSVEPEGGEDGEGRKGGDSGNRGELDEEKSGKINVRALARSLCSAKTADDVEEVLKDFQELHPAIFSTLIKGFGIEKRLEPAFALLEWLKRIEDNAHGLTGPNLIIYNSLLGAVKQSGQFGEVDKVMEDMKEKGILPDVITFNTLMAVYVEQSRPNEALDLLAKIREHSLSPCASTYSTALLAYRKMEDADGALQFFFEMREKYHSGEIGKDVDVDWEKEFVKLENLLVRICHQVMRRWLLKGEHLSTKVLKLLTDMDRVGLKCNQTEHERLVWACTAEGHYLVVKELYQRLRELDTTISLSVCNHVIWLMGKARKWWAALEVYEDLLDKGPKPNAMSYELISSHFNVLLAAASRRGIWRWGVRLINKMQDKGLKPGSREWNAVLVACSKASETSAAVEIFRRMVDQGEKPTIISYGALLSALEKGKMYDEAHRVWEHMCKVGVKPNLHAYTILISIYIGQGRLDEVDSIIQEMVASEIEPTVVTYNAIISGCAKTGMGSAAYKWYQRMREQNVVPNEITYEMLIEALAGDAKPRLAYDIYLRARNEGLLLSSKAFDTVIESSRYFSASMDLYALGPRPDEKRKILRTRKMLSEFCNLADVPRRGKPFNRDEIYVSQRKEQ
ncbi:hypothetical protein ACLOJK_007071 [Asimina triloba]